MSDAPLTVKGVCLDVGGRVLVGRNPRGEWELPGGRPHDGEDPADALVREIREETGLTVRVAQRLSRGPLEVLPGRVVEMLAFGCELAESYPSPRRSAEHSEVAFRALEELGDELPSGYRDAVVRWRDRACE